MKTKIKIGSLFLALLLCLAGCAQDSETVEVVSDAVTADDWSGLQDDSIQEFSEENFIQKNTVPVIKIDTLGYKSHDAKTIFFAKGKVGDVFYVVDADSKERVYEGRIESKRKGDFSAVTKEGNYYIEAVRIGRSYTFPIQRDRYRNTFVELQNKVLAYANNPEKSFEERIFVWDRLLQYYRDDIPTDPQELDMLKAAADELISESDTYKNNTTAYIEELAVYSASMSIFYQTMREYDETAAAAYLAEAEDAYILVEAEKAMLLDESYLFYPAAALYCATGKAPYESATEDYIKDNTERDFLDAEASEQALTADEMYLFGVMAYLNTRYTVNMELCESLMRHLTEKAEIFADQAKFENYFCVAGNLRNRLLADRLYVIAVVEHVIVSKEYTNILKNGIHYLGGCNETGKAYFSEYGIQDAARDEKSGEAFLGSAYLDVLDKMK